MKWSGQGFDVWEQHHLSEMAATPDPEASASVNTSDLKGIDVTKAVEMVLVEGNSYPVALWFVIRKPTPPRAALRQVCMRISALLPR
jgi:hypothetical protein